MTYKIYKIVPCDENADENDVYYGSTSQHLLCSRFSNHRQEYKLWKEDKWHYVTSFTLFEKYGYYGCKIVLVEEFENITESELRHKEADYIENNKCINIGNPRPVTAEEYKKRAKDYHKNIIMTDPIKKEKHIAKAKAFLKQKEEEGPIQCECGDTYTYKHKSRHISTEKHRLAVDAEYRAQKEAEFKAKTEEKKERNKAYKAAWYQANKDK
jgi:hypothetical protein